VQSACDHPRREVAARVEGDNHPDAQIIVRKCRIGTDWGDWAIDNGNGSSGAMGDTGVEDEDLLSPMEADRELLVIWPM